MFYSLANYILFWPIIGGRLHLLNKSLKCCSVCGGEIWIITPLKATEHWCPSPPPVSHILFSGHLIFRSEQKRFCCCCSRNRGGNREPCPRTINVQHSQRQRSMGYNIELAEFADFHGRNLAAFDRLCMLRIWVIGDVVVNPSCHSCLLFRSLWRQFNH